MQGSENLSWYIGEHIIFGFPFITGKENRNNIVE